MPQSQEDYGRRRRPESQDDPHNRTQAIPRISDNSETRTFARPGNTHTMPKMTPATPDVNPPEYDIRRRLKPTDKANPKPYKAGPVMRWFGHALAAVFAAFCLGIICITFGFVLWKYYNHLFH